jgi:hypothetical protein
MTLFVSHQSFTEMLQGLVASGCQFKAVEENGGITVTFNGSY